MRVATSMCLPISSRSRIGARARPCRIILARGSQSAAVPLGASPRAISRLCSRLPTPGFPRRAHARSPPRGPPRVFRSPEDTCECPLQHSAHARTGYVAAKRIAIDPPSETPIIAARSEPDASITARRSSIRVSSVGKLPTRSDIPVPRLSNRIRRQNEAKRRKKAARLGISQANSTCETNGGVKTRSNGPSPDLIGNRDVPEPA